MTSPAQLRAQGVQQPAAITAVVQRLRELAADAASQIPEGAEGLAGDQVVAVSDEQPALGGQHRTDRLDQARLADPRLPADEHHRPVAGRRFPRGSGQRRQLMLALQNQPAHAYTVSRSAAEVGVVIATRAGRAVPPRARGARQHRSPGLSRT